MDSARRQTDQQISAMRREFAADYDSLGGSMSAHLAEYLADFVDEDGNVEATALTGRGWARMRDQLARECTEANESSMRTLGGRLGEVRQLTAEGAPAESTVPYPAIDCRADLAWNRRKVEAAARQGIGRTPSEAGERMRQVADMNSNATARRVRTAINGAENAGRMDAMIARGGSKRWVTVQDERVRDSHAALHGAVIPVDEPFGNGLMFPGDPSGPPEEVYNCRCTLEWVEDTLAEELPEDLEPEDDTRAVVEGQDISDTWRWDPDSSEFDYAIEDVMHSQGFDGLPRVVDADEFDRLYTGDQPLLLRTFSAPDAETLAAYDDMLRNGKWYVDCSNGGAQYGQGMYTAGVYGEKGARKTQKLYDGAMEEMHHYQTINGRSGMESMIETMTLDPSAKVVTYKDLTKSPEFKKAFKQFDSDQNYRAYTHVAAGLREYVEDADFLTDADRKAFTRAIDKATASLEKSRAKGTAITRSNLDYIPGEIAKRELGWTGDLDDYKGYYGWLGERGLDTNADRDTRAHAISSQAWEGYTTREQYAGIYGASRGYDAINAVGHGASRSYTVVLNRTKVIIRE